MASLLGLIFVVFVVVFGIGACWMIAANGNSQLPATDSFGNQAPATSIAQQGAASDLATSTMPILPVVFIIVVCVIIVSAAMWLWKTGTSKTGKNGY
jgi:hypothetical protein